LDFYGQRALKSSASALSADRLRDAAIIQLGQFFSNEAILTARLALCPHVVKVIDHDVSIPFMALEFCEGGSLTDRMKASFSYHDALKWIAQLATALKSAHALRPDLLVHRDLKPDNLLIQNNQLLVSDFGTSQMISDSGLPETLHGGYTLAYAAPEAFDGEALPGTDIWSLGVILYELLCGVRPFSGKTTMSFIKAIAMEQPASLNNNARFAVSRAVHKLLMNCLEKKPALRPTACEILETLESELGVKKTEDLERAKAPLKKTAAYADCINAR
jgi:serine/threonine protein kinase